MLIWFIFFLVSYFIIFIYDSSKSKRNKIFFYFLFLFVIIYFAAFRDGLGMDYTAYKSYCERDVLRSASILLTEPLAAILESFCYYTNFSAVIFFFVTSAITCILCLWVYKQYNYAYIAFFVFITYTNLYLSSLNLVRQFVASSLIVFGTYYFIIRKKNILFFFFIFLAFLFHKSSIFLFFIYFLKKNDYNPLLWTILLFGSWVINIQPLFNIPIIREIFISTNYLDYLNYDATAYSKTSLSNLYMHFIILYFLWNKNHIMKMADNNSCILSLKLSIISVICANFSAGDLPFAYRFTVFFSVFIPILFSFLPQLTNKNLAKTIIYIPLIILIWSVLIGQRNNRIYCPNRILPIESIYDENYRPYENPDVIVF